MKRILVGVGWMTVSVSLAACGGAVAPAPAPAAVVATPPAVAPAGVAPAGSAPVTLPTPAPVAAIAPARWSSGSFMGPRGWVVPVPRSLEVALGGDDTPLTDAELAAQGAQRIEPTQWVLRPGAAPCLATVTAYVVYAPGLDRDGHYDESQINAVLDGCAPSAGDAAPAVASDAAPDERDELAWVVAPSAMAGLGGETALRFVAVVTTAADNFVDNARARHQTSLPKAYRAALALPKLARGRVRDWTRHAVATKPALAQLYVEDFEADPYDDGSGAGAPSEPRAQALFVAGARSAIEPELTLVGALAVGGAARVALFDDGYQFATAAIVDGSMSSARTIVEPALAEPTVHTVHALAGY